MNSFPLVSVCIPSYNHAKFLPYCIESVLAQTYPNIEVIIVDDGSKDDSLAIAKSYEEKYPDRIKVYCHPNNENRGISNTANYAFNLAKGIYWSGLCSDDALYKNKIEKQVAFLEASPETGFVYSYANFINLDGKNLPGLFGTDITNDTDPLETLLYENLIPGMTVLANRSALSQVGLHDENLIYSDWDLWLRFIAKYRFGFIPEPLVEYRIHNYNTSVGIHPSKIYEYIKAVYLKLQNSGDVEDSRLSEEKYQKIISSNLRKLPDREKQAIKIHAIRSIDKYFDSVELKNYSIAVKSVKEALFMSPQTVLSPRRLAAIIKRMLLSFRN